MAKKRTPKNRYTDPRFLFSVGMAIVFISIFVIGLVATPSTPTPTISELQSTSTPAQQTNPVVIPTPEGEITLVANQQPSTQINGLFQASPPVGWITQFNDYDPTILRGRMAFSNPDRLSVIEYLLQFGVNYPALQNLADEFFTDSYFVDAWAEYSAFSETNRAVTETNVTIDFILVSQEIGYLGRQVAWLDGDWLNMVRLIVPDNNPQLLQALTDTAVPTLIAFKDQAGIDPSMASYADFEQGFLFRHPNWRQISGSLGTPAVFGSFDDKNRLTARTIAETPIESLDAAEAYVRQLHPSAQIIAGQVTTRQFADGYLISYQDRDPDGDPTAGLIALLNDTQGRLLIADITSTIITADLLSTSDDPSVDRLREISDSFMALPPS